MPRANFDDTLSLPTKAQREAATLAGEEPPGPFAKGPVPSGDKLVWVYVWIIQNGPGNHAAAAYGETPHGANPSIGTWESKTHMAYKSSKFDPKRPALATAMALVRHGNRREIDWWTEAIMLHDPDAPPAGG